MNGNDKEIFDPEVLDSLRDAIGERVNHIIELYLNDVPESIVTMKGALENLEYETVGRFAHSLKSSSANVGAMQTSALALGLEQTIKAGETDSKVIADHITKIEASFNQTKVLMIKYIQ